MPADCLVYVITAGSKHYVGVAQNLSKRLREHRRTDSLIGRAMRKHGWSVEVILEASRADCLREEVRLIQELGTLNPKGYNLTAGGDGVCGEAGAVRAARSEAMKEVMARPGRVAKASATAKAAWSDRATRARMEAGLAKVSQKTSDRARASWAARRNA